MKILKNVIMLVTMTTLFFSIAGCGQGNGAGTQGPGSNNSESEWEMGQGVIPSTIGSEEPEITVNEEIAQLMLGAYNEDLWEKAGFSAPTGKWFMSNDRGVLGFGLTSGTQKAGENLFVSFYAHSSGGVELDRDVRILLSEREDLATEKELIMEETVTVEKVDGEEIVFTGTLPEKENAVYIFSVEVLDEAGEVEDSMVTLIHVPVAEINATLATNQTSYGTSDKELTLLLDNHGPTTLFFGVYYTIEKKVEGTWRVVPMDLAFIDIGIMLPMGDQYEETIDISGLSQGEYRVIKEIHADGLDLKETVAVEFTIE